METGSENALDRRSFLKGAALAGAGVVGASALAACSPSQDGKSGSASSSDAAGAELDGSSATPIDPVAVPSSWDNEADVVVIGCGGGGLNCSYICSQAGLKVIAIDKNHETGGATQEASYWVGGGSSVMPWDSTDPYLAAVYGSRDKYIASFSPCDTALMTSLVDNGAKCLDWMNTIGNDWVKVVWYAIPNGSSPNNNMSTPGTSMQARCVKTVTDHMKDICDQSGVQFMLNTTASALIKDGDTVVGVQAQDANGNKINIHGTKAVVVAAGGMADNLAMLKKYIPSAYEGCAACCIMPTHTGEGIRMAIGAGADTTGFDTCKIYDGGLDYLQEGVGPFYRYMYRGDGLVAKMPWLTVNKDCQRFMKSTYIASYAGYEGTMEGNQPGHRAYVIFDDDFEDDILNKLDTTGSVMPLMPSIPDIDRLPDDICAHNWTDDVDAAEQAGIIKSADTIADLANQLGLDATKLQAAIDDWNTCCTNGADPTFGQDPKTLLPIVKAPFHGAKVGGWIWHSSCGVHVNPQMQALDTDGNIIPGLYAVGQSIGGDKGYAATTSGGPLAGVGLTFTTGYIAGHTITGK
jgi:fumarate reductase flavoprotein subunit